MDEDKNVTTAPEAPTNGKSQSHYLLLFTGFLLLAALIWLCCWFFYFRYFESTDDAYVNGSLVNINTAIPGSVKAFYADNTDLVVEGQLLVLLDETEYRLRYENELASLATILSQVRQLHAAVAVNRSNVSVKKAVVDKLKYDYENRQQLVDSKAISDQDYVHSKDDLTVAQYEHEQAKNQLLQSLEAIENTTVEKHSLIQQQIAKIRSSFYDLQRCSIFAPTTGYVAQRSVNVGQRLTQTSQIMSIIPKDYIWVDANYKETQLTYMRIGQPATVWFDQYGSSVKFEGKVLGIASGTGSVFSIIPPQNATGNWIKIVQRLPVRIGLDPKMIEKYPLRLGLSSTVNVDLTNINLPMLAQIPANSTIASTNVFKIDDATVNKAIEEIMRRQLYQK